MFPFGSGMKPTNPSNPSPSAPPLVQSNQAKYPNAPAQMPQPFGSGIGFKPQITSPPFGVGFVSPPQSASYPAYNQTPPQVAPYPSYHQASPQPPPNHYAPNTTQYQPPQQAYPPPTQYQPSQQAYSPPNNYAVAQQSYQSPPPPQGYQSYNYGQAPPQIYPNLQQSAQFAYNHSNNPNTPRSTSDYMRKGTPTVLPSENFDPQVDAATVRKAMKGFGCDEKALVEVICKRSNQQRQEIAKVFKTNFGKDLIENIQSETRGNFETLLVALLTPILDFYCKEMHDAMAGLGTDEDVLIEILCTLSNNEITTIKDHYLHMYGKDLEAEIKGEASGGFKRLLVSLCNANRDESGATDIEDAKADATALLRAGELRFGTDESTFNSILCRKNYEQLKLIFKEYETMTGHSFETAIENEFSGDIRDGFTAIFRCVNNKAEFFAHQLMKSMKGLGTNDRQLIRLIVTRCEIDMTEIKAAFERLFNETLKECIKGDTSGDYKTGLYALIGEKRSS